MATRAGCPVQQQLEQEQVYGLQPAFWVGNFGLTDCTIADNFASTKVFDTRAILLDSP